MVTSPVKGILSGGFPNYGYLFGGPHNKDYSILGSILGSPYFGKLPSSVIGPDISRSFQSTRLERL